MVMRLVGPMADSHGVELASRVSPEADGIPAGPLGVLLLNGLRNAVQACRSEVVPGHVILDVGRGAGGELVIEISDTGRGRAVDNAGDGHGLGLALCRRIVADLRGRMELVDRPGGRGTVLRVALPPEKVEP